MDIPVNVSVNDLRKDGSYSWNVIDDHNKSRNRKKKRFRLEDRNIEFVRVFLL